MKNTLLSIVLLSTFCAPTVLGENLPPACVNDVPEIRSAQSLPREYYPSVNPAYYDFSDLFSQKEISGNFMCSLKMTPKEKYKKITNNLTMYANWESAPNWSWQSGKWRNTLNVDPSPPYPAPNRFSGYSYP